MALHRATQRKLFYTVAAVLLFTLSGLFFSYFGTIIGSQNGINSNNESYARRKYIGNFIIPSSAIDIFWPPSGLESDKVNVHIYVFWCVCYTRGLCMI